MERIPEVATVCDVLTCRVVVGLVVPIPTLPVVTMVDAVSNDETVSADPVMVEPVNVETVSADPVMVEPVNDETVMVLPRMVE